jgi:hypothetical protein
VDPDPDDPIVFGPSKSVSGSVGQRYGSGTYQNVTDPQYWQLLKYGVPVQYRSLVKVKTKTNLAKFYVSKNTQNDDLIYLALLVDVRVVNLGFKRNLKIENLSHRF